MSKRMLVSEIQKELFKLNDSIDRAIISGRPYKKEARRHKELLATLHTLRSDLPSTSFFSRFTRRIKSPVYVSLSGGGVRRVLG